MCEFTKKELDMFPYMVAVTNKNLEIKSVNKAFEIETNKTEEELIGQKIKSIIKGPDFKRMYRLLSSEIISSFVAESILKTDQGKRDCCVCCHITDCEKNGRSNNAIYFKIFKNYKVSRPKAELSTRLCNYLLVTLLFFITIVSYRVNDQTKQEINQLRILNKQVQNEILDK